MSTEVKYLPLGGGLNLIDSQITMPEGMLTECINYEQIFGKQGYSRIEGYERYDGRLEPHSAAYYIQEFDTGTAEIFAGDVITGTDSTAVVLLVEITSGTWGDGDVVGRLIIGNITGTWEDNEAIQVIGSTKAMSSAVTYQGSLSETLDATYKAQAVADRRAEITAVPGSGNVLGVGVANSVVYAVRNVADGTTATLYKASGSGWTAVQTGLYPGGAYKMIQANFSGSSSSLYLFGCDGKNRPFRYDGTTFTRMPAIFGSQATSVTSNTIGTGAKTFVVAETSRSWTASQSLIIWQTGNAANWMIGTVTSYTSGTNTLVMNITSSGGSGTITDWEIGLSSFKDKPFDLVAHRDHMFQAYPSGQLQTSNLGDPMVYTSTAPVTELNPSTLPLRAAALPSVVEVSPSGSFSAALVLISTSSKPALTPSRAALTSSARAASKRTKRDRLVVQSKKAFAIVTSPSQVVCSAEPCPAG